ncbi:hypothetical protein GCM10029963_14530 [Micromonospora andamanensis]
MPGHTDPLGPAGGAVADEHVLLAVGVAGYQVGRGEVNATYRPSALIAGSLPPPPAGPPVAETLIRPVVPVTRSRTNTSDVALVSSDTRGAVEAKATYRPSALIAGVPAPASASVPSAARLTRVVTPVARSRTNTSSAWLVSPGTRFVAVEAKATYRPSALIAGR